MGSTGLLVQSRVSTKHGIRIKNKPILSNPVQQTHPLRGRLVWGNQNNVIPGKVIPGNVIPGKPVYLCLVMHENIVSDSCEFHITVFGLTWESFFFFLFFFWRTTHIFIQPKSHNITNLIMTIIFIILLWQPNDMYNLKYFSK